MKCPNRDEWVPYVFGEATPQARKSLSAHLESCRQCEAEIANWKRSLEKLDRWTLPEPETRLETAPPIWRWALAALVVLGIGFALGRLFAPANTESLRAGVEASVKASLAAELQSALARVQAQSSNAIASAELRLARNSEADIARITRGLVEAMNNARQEDRRTTEAFFDTLQREHEAQLFSIRSDLETVASLTDEEIRQAQMRFIEIAAGNPANP
jgi:hypothetical protein